MRRIREFIALAVACVSIGSFASTGDPVPFDGPALVPEREDIFRPKLIHRVEPVFPQGKLYAHPATEMWIAFVVDTKGYTRDVRCFFSLNKEAEAAAIQAVEQWKFEPGLYHGRVVNTRMVVELKFDLPTSGSK